MRSGEEIVGSGFRRWRLRLFQLGCGLMIAGWACFSMLCIQHLRQRVAHSNWDLAYWLWGGILASFLSLVLVLFGRGWKRWLFSICCFVELYLWFSWMLWLVQIS
jgi:hypothetical protein